MTVRSNAERRSLTLSDVRPYLKHFKAAGGGQYRADCPLCGDNGQHLYLRQEGDTLLMHCMKCEADFRSYMQYLTKQGARPPEAPVEKKNISVVKPAKPVEDYDHEYKLPDGTVQYVKRRRKWADGHKVFTFGYMDGDKAIAKKPPDAVTLYNLDLLEKASPDTRLYIVEGEKCADAMTSRGLLATTSNTGAKKSIKLTPTDEKLLYKFVDRIVIPDNDEKGADYVSAWDGARVLDLKRIWPECPPKGDVADYFEAGRPLEAIKDYEFPKQVSLDNIPELTREDLTGMGVFDALYAVRDAKMQTEALVKLHNRAKDLKIYNDFERMRKAYGMSRVQAGIGPGNRTNFPDVDAQINCGDWTAGISGVYRMKMVGSGNMVKEVASPIPVMPTELLSNVEDRSCKMRVAFYKDGQWRSILQPRSMFASATKIIDLSDQMLEVNSDNSKLLVKFLADCVALNPAMFIYLDSTDHLGWVNGKFVPYEETIKLDCEAEYRALIQSVADKGDLDAWINYVRPLRENIYLRLTMAASFASVLIEKVDALPFVFHLWGGTESGKTVGMMVAASIWGNPGWGHLVRTMNMTANSMMATAAVLHNLPFFGDELQGIKERYDNYDKLIMNICEGINRGRMDSRAKMQKQQTWKNAFIFTGEEPCTKSSSGGGTKNRVIEVELDGMVIEDGSAVVAFINQNYGLAGPEYLKHIEGKAIRKDYKAAAKAIVGGIDTTDKQAMAMALLMIADDYAREAFFTNEKGLTLDDVRPYLKTKAEVDVSERAYRMLVGLLNENIDKFSSSNSSRTVLWGDYLGNSGWSVNKTVLERELNNMGFDFNAVKKRWAENGYLERSSTGRYYSQSTQGGQRGEFVRILLKDPKK